MKNFTGGKVAKGEVVQGLVELPKKLDLYEPFKFTISGESVEFRINQRRPAGLRKPLTLLYGSVSAINSAGRPAAATATTMYCLLLTLIGHWHARRVCRQQRFRNDLASRLVVRAEP